MTKGLIGKKIGMSQVFDEKGDIIPVTILQVGPCFVSQLKTKEKDGYAAIQLAYDEVKVKNITKPEVGHLKKNNLAPMRFLKEFASTGEAIELGKLLTAKDVFTVSDTVKVTGVSKGKGFQGVVKRYGHRGGPEAHGSRHHRAPGSIGACATPSRVFKGVKLPGRMGGLKTSIRNLKIVRIQDNENLIFIAGSIPGTQKSLVTIEKI